MEKSIRIVKINKQSLVRLWSVYKPARPLLFLLFSNRQSSQFFGLSTSNHSFSKTHSFLHKHKMLSLKFILVAAATFTFIVSAVPTPETGNSLNIAPGSLPIVGSTTSNVPRSGADGPPDIDNRDMISDMTNYFNSVLNSVGNLLFGLGAGRPVGDKRPAKRSGSSCKMVIQKCHDDIAVIVVKISLFTNFDLFL